MRIAEHVTSYTHPGDRKFYVSILDVPLMLELKCMFWDKVDPCCRWPWRLWQPFVEVYHSALAKKYRVAKEVKIPVTEEWARENFDWDITLGDDEDD